MMNHWNVKLNGSKRAKSFISLIGMQFENQSYPPIIGINFSRETMQTFWAEGNKTYALSCFDFEMRSYITHFPKIGRASCRERV